MGNGREKMGKDGKEREEEIRIGRKGSRVFPPLQSYINCCTNFT